MMKINSYKDLIVWQKSLNLVLLVYELTEKFPEKERFGIVSQMRRAAVSITSNIAEGYARQHLPEYIQFLSVSYGSAAELETQLIISQRLNFGSNNDYLQVFSLLNEVSKILNVMIRKLKTKR